MNPAEFANRTAVAGLSEGQGTMLWGLLSWTARLRPLVWLPGLAYYCWLDGLVFGALDYTSGVYKVQAVAFLGCQTLLVFLLILLADGFLAESCGRFLRIAFVTGVYLFLGALYIDFILYKLMAIHLPRGLSILCQDGVSHLGINWVHTGIPSRVLHVWLAWAAGIAVAILMFAFATETRRLGWGFTMRATRVVAIGGYFMLACQILSTGDDEQWVWSFGELKAALPFYFGGRVPVPGRKYQVPALRAPESGHGTLDRVIAGEKSLASQPDIFLFVLESARGDFITREITPNLAAFSTECLPFPDALASGNASHISWYSLLTANYGLRFGMAKRSARRFGSAPIALLKRAGYRIDVFCSSTLDYHEIDKIAFGDRLELCDSMFDAQKQGIGDAPARDLAVNKAMLEALESPPGRRLFLIFYHSTHHDYDWPASDPAPFTPYASAWNYADFNISRQQLRLIMNRYRNALHFQDRLIGEVLSALKQKGQYAQALIAVTGDHGEEFLEHGKLLHASNLFRPQTHIPFLLRLPAGMASPGELRHRLPLASHVDLIPTLLDCLGIEVTNAFDGQSLFRKTTDEVVITAENADGDPVRFCIQSERYKAFFQYESATRPTARQRTLVFKPGDRLPRQTRGYRVL